MQVKHLFLLLFFLFISLTGKTQQLYYNSFDNEESTLGWQSSTLTPEGGDALPAFTLSPDGTAPGQYWNERPAIQSNSQGGALLFNGDALLQAGARLNQPVQITSAPISLATANGRIGVRFQQYFRNIAGSCSLGYSVDNGESWVDLPINGQYGANVASSNAETITLEIAPAEELINGSLLLRFALSGPAYFWLIDDLEVIALPPDFGETFPEKLGPYLDSLGYAYAVDSLGGAYVPNELLILYTEDATMEDMDSLRKEFQVIDYKSCSCNDRFERWTLPDTLSADSLIFKETFSEDTKPFISRLKPTCECLGQTYCLTAVATDKCNVPAWQPITTPDNKGAFMMIEALNNANELLVYQQQLNLTAGQAYYLAFDVFAGIDGGPSPSLRIEIAETGSTTNTTVLWQGQVQTGHWTTPAVSWNNSTITNAEIRVIQEVGTGTGYVYGLDNICIGALRSTGQVLESLINNKGQVRARNKTEEVDFNHHNFDILEAGPAGLVDMSPLSGLPLGTTPKRPNEHIVAILDTGLDYAYNTTDYSFPSKLFMVENPCAGDEFIGWNFVHDNNNPNDDQGHGTHVAGIFYKQLSAWPEENCSYRLLPVKTHDNNGIGTNFSTSCGLYYAGAQGASIVNASWGYYGIPSAIMSDAIDYLLQQDALLVTSAGNDSVQINLRPHFPTSYPQQNVIGVGALNQTLTDLTPFSNRDNGAVEFAAPGEMINSSLPAALFSTGEGVKSGSSMAAPVVAAALLPTLCCGGVETTVQATDLLRLVSQTLDPIQGGIQQGHYLSSASFNPARYNSNCMVVDVDDTLDADNSWQLFPNPVGNTLHIRYNGLLRVGGRLDVLAIDGRVVATKALTTSDNEFLLPVSKLAAGMYVVRYHSSDYSGVIGRVVVR